MAEAEEKSGFLSLKDLLIVAPLLSSAIALVYDVGYFYWIGISYYVLFSLSEHIVFALPALPLGLVAILSLSSGYISYKLGERATERATLPISERPIPAEDAGRIHAAKVTHRKKALGKLGLIAAFGLILCLCSLYLSMFTMAAIIGSISLAAMSRVLFPEVVSASAAMIGGYGTALVLASFAAGLESAKSDLGTKPPAMVVNLTNNEIQGQLLRSGERGLLFYDAVTKKN